MRLTLYERVQFLHDKHKSSYSSYACQFLFHQSFSIIQHTPHKHGYGILKTCVMQANICNAYTKYNIQVYELAPPTCDLQILIDPISFVISFVCSPIFTIFYELLPLCQQLAQKVSSNFRQVRVKPCEVRIIFPYLVQTRLLAKDI